MKDPQDRKTLDLVEQIENPKEPPKESYKQFQRFHIIRNGKKTTVSIDTLSAEFLAVSLGEEPHTKEARKAIVQWIKKRMEKSESYDKNASYLFSQWLKREILRKIVDRKISAKRTQWMNSFFE